MIRMPLFSEKKTFSNSLSRIYVLFFDLMQMYFSVMMYFEISNGSKISLIKTGAFCAHVFS